MEFAGVGDHAVGIAAHGLGKQRAVFTDDVFQARQHIPDRLAAVGDNARVGGHTGNWENTGQTFNFLHISGIQIQFHVISS